MTLRMAPSFLTGCPMVKLYLKSYKKTYDFLNNIYCISGHSSIKFIKYPMAVLGGKSRPKLKNLKPFIKVIVIHIFSFCQRKEGRCTEILAFFILQDSQIVQLVCKDSNQQESMVKELEHENGDTNFFLADPGNPISFISTRMFSSWSISVKKSN